MIAWEDCLGFYICPYCRGRGHGDVVYFSYSTYLDADQDTRTILDESWRIEVKREFESRKYKGHKY